MKKNFSIIIAGGVGIAIIVLIVALYNNQESEITKIDEPIEIELENDVSEIAEIDEPIEIELEMMFQKFQRFKKNMMKLKIK